VALWEKRKGFIQKGLGGTDFHGDVAVRRCQEPGTVVHEGRKLLGSWRKQRVGGGYRTKKKKVKGESDARPGGGSGNKFRKILPAQGREVSQPDRMKEGRRR